MVSRDASLAEQVKASALDPLLGIIAGVPQPQPQPEARERGRAEKGVSIMRCDMPCSITTSNITSFNLYNTCIDLCGCYHSVITAQGSAQLSFRGCLIPPSNITRRDKGIQVHLVFLTLSLDHPSLPGPLSPWNSGKMCIYTIHSGSYEI